MSTLALQQSNLFEVLEFLKETVKTTITDITKQIAIQNQLNSYEKELLSIITLIAKSKNEEELEKISSESLILYGECVGRLFQYLNDEGILQDINLYKINSLVNTEVAKIIESASSNDIKESLKYVVTGSILYSETFSKFIQKHTSNTSLSSIMNNEKMGALIIEEYGEAIFKKLLIDLLFSLYILSSQKKIKVSANIVEAAVRLMEQYIVDIEDYLFEKNSSPADYK